MLRNDRVFYVKKWKVLTMLKAALSQDLVEKCKVVMLRNVKVLAGKNAKVCGDQAGLWQRSISQVGLKLLLPPQRQYEWEERSRGV